jgi:hypothetical protein
VIGLWHYNVERALRASGVGWTIIRPHHFMQNFLDPLVLDPTDSVVRSSAGDGAIPFVDTRDIAAVSARVLMEPEARPPLGDPANDLEKRADLDRLQMADRWIGLLSHRMDGHRRQLRWRRDGRRPDLRTSSHQRVSHLARRMAILKRSRWVPTSFSTSTS